MNDLEQLKTLLFGAEKQALDSITDRVERRETRAADVADVLPEAVRLSHRQNDELVETLREPVGECLHDSFHREPDKYADALYPVMGPAIRKSIMSALRAFAQQINETIEQSLSVRGVRWRFDAWRSGIPFGEYVVQRTLLYRIEQAYLISRENGLLIGHVHHQASRIKDSDAVSAMFTAIQDFIKESFSPDRSGRLETADMGEFTLWAVHGPHALLVCVIRGVPPRSLRGDLSGILERIHFRYADAVRQYNGDTTTVSGVEEELANCLRFEAMQPKDPDKKRPWFPLLVLIAIVVGALGYVGFRNWRVIEAQGALEHVIESTPGWYVSSVEYSDSAFVVSGLRDPLAKSMDEVAAAAGLAREQLVGDLRPFQSLDPEMVFERTRLALSPPPGVSLKAHSETIVASGEAPYDWIQDASRKAASGMLQMPVHLEAVTPAERTELEREVGAIGKISISFVDGINLTPAEESALTEHAQRIGQLADLARRIEEKLDIAIVGYTDGIGAPAANRELAGLRANVASSRLLAQGIPAPWIETSLVVDSTSTTAVDLGKRRVTISLSFQPGASDGPSVE